MNKYAVIGLGNFGYWVARTLFEANMETIAIDTDQEKVQKIKPYSDAPVVADATDRKVLMSLGLSQVNAAVISLGGNISASILITMYLSEMGVKEILVKAIDEDHGKILRKVGATEIIFPEKAMGIKVAKGLISPNILEYFEMAGDYTIAEVATPTSFIGKSLAELALPQKHHLQVIAIKELIPENFVFVPKADFRLKDSDILLLLGKEHDIERLRND